MSYLSGNFSALIDKGRVRETNEDAALGIANAYGNILLAVADGMGGANKGEYASNKLLDSIKADFLNIEKEFTSPRTIIKWLNQVIDNANAKIYEKSIKDEAFKGMGTTLSLVMLVKDIMVTAQVGDSRIYLLKDKKLTQISVDQTYATYLLHENKISPSEVATHKHRHKITNAVGTKARCNIDFNHYKYNREKILVCSDGLYNNIAFPIMESILIGNDSLNKKCMELIAFGNASGGTDNMAVVIWESN